MADTRIITGADELAKFAGGIPPESANHLQNVLRLVFVDHCAEIIRSSTFKSISRKSLNALVIAWPRRAIPRGAALRPIDQVEAGSETYWRGLSAADASEGVAALIEKRIGRPINRPTRARFLLIPQGDMLVNGKPARLGQGGAKKLVTVRAIGGHTPHNTLQNRRVGHSITPVLQSGILQGTAVIETPRGLRLIQKLAAKARGLHETLNTGDGSRKITARQLGERWRILATLKAAAKQAQPLDYFPSWDRGRAAREARYDRMLNSIIAGRSAGRAAA